MKYKIFLKIGKLPSNMSPSPTIAWLRLGATDLVEQEMCRSEPPIGDKSWAQLLPKLLQNQFEAKYIFPICDQW